MADSPLRSIPGAVTAPRGFRAAALNCGIKQGRPDLALVASDRPATVAVTLTRNWFRAAPVQVTEEHASSGTGQAIICNSGIANAASGAEGLAQARRMCEITGQALGLPASEVLVCSTGHIGEPLPLDKIEPGIRTLASQLSPEGGEEAARGIMTTDTRPKSLAVEFEVEGVPVRLGGICKGAGMICPHMATMLCFLTTDVALAPHLLRSALCRAVEHSFNCLTVDGDMSTNDTVILLANGASGVELRSAEAPGFAVFREALEYVTRELAKLIAADGEGASKFVEIRVTGAETFQEARYVGRAVANYNLMKTALYGGDFNWGRLAAAVGTVKSPVDPETVTLRMAGVLAWDRGRVAPFDLEDARRRMREREILIEVDLGHGSAEATVWTCDLTPGYIEYNAAYEVATLGEHAED